MKLRFFRDAKYQRTNVLENLGVQCGYEALSPTTSTGFTAAKIKPTSGECNGKDAKAVLVGVITQTINFNMDADGTAPTATTGMPLAASNYYTVVGELNIRNFRCIDTAAGASKVHCLFFF